MNVDLESLDIDSLPRVEIGPGCYKRSVPGLPGTAAWIMDIEPGCAWPQPDRHDAAGEYILVLEGDLIEGEEVFGPGTYIAYAANSVHQPRTETGVRFFGFNAA